MTSQRLSSTTLPGRPVLVAFMLFVVFAGGASVAIRVAYGELPPFWTSAARFGLGALGFWVLVWNKKLRVPRGQALLGAVIFGTLFGLAFVLIAWGLVDTPASFAQILMALVPLFTLFLSTLHGVEAITRRGILGSILALAGIALTVGGASSGDLSLLPVVALMGAALFNAEGGVVIKRFPSNPPIMTNAIAMTIAAIILGSVSLITGERWAIPTQTDTWVAFIYLVVIVSLGAFMLYMYVLNNWTASGTSYGFVLTPLVTIVVASTVAGERITVNFLFGAVLVLSGVFVGALLPSREKPAAIEECKDRSGQVMPRCI